MNKKIILPILLLLFIGCGKKDYPKPKDTLNIPTPTGVEISLNDDGVLISNNTDMRVLVERAVSEIGDLKFPSYKKIVLLDKNSVYLDTTTEPDVRYSYRLSSYSEKYNAYSSPITHVVSYRGKVAFEKVSWEVKNNKVCVELIKTKNVDHYSVFLNGVQRSEKGPCYDLPNTASVLLVIVPYSESDTQGSAYSTTIKRDLKTSFLPPQNIKIIRRQKKATLSWDMMPTALTYKITKISENGETATVETDATLHTFDVTGCTDFLLQSVFKSKVSPTVKVTSCE